MKQLLGLLLLSVATEAHAQESQPTLTAASFKATGLHNEQPLTKLYLGDFRNVNLEQENMYLNYVFGQYLEAFGVQCDASLPANKVEIMRNVCVREQHTVNASGRQIGPSTCVESREEGTGYYADPTLYAAHRQVGKQQAGVAGREIVRQIMKQQNPMAVATNTVSNIKTIKEDMYALVRMNGCESPGLKRFQENLMLYALGKRPIPLSGTPIPLTSTPSATATEPAAGAPFKDSNYTRLLEDLMSEYAKTWMVNRYTRGSVSDVVVSERDDAGRPLKIVGLYRFVGLGGRSQAKATVNFSDGLPESLYCSDYPTLRVSPDRRVIAAYTNGSYHE